MYLFLILKVPKERAESIEEEIYLYEKLSWETEEKEEEVLFKFYIPISLNDQDKEKLFFVEALASKFDDIHLEYALTKRENWEVIWKYHFKPLEIGKKLIILPSWEEELRVTERIPIYIDPGQAFGTGHHPTTQLMLENIEYFLEELCQKFEDPYILDMGCGTGILSIACAKLCPKAIIYAVDIDELALEAAKKNITLNQIASPLYILRELPKEENLKFNLILANIGTKELKNLAPTFKKLSRPKETLLLLSGILKEDLMEIVKFYRNFSFRPIKSQYLREWALIAFKVM
ncbi:MAG: 50S ribosomal protein L11 methyltransferase [Caldimicrobium sp.]